MPKAKSAPKSRRALTTMVESFGFSLDAISLMRQQFPKANAKQLVRGFARFLLSAESREEYRWRPFARAVLAEQFDSPIILERAKAITFNLPGNSYTPDFSYILEDATRVMVEVKGSVFQPGYRDARAKLRMAATLNFDYVFVETMPNKECPNGWSLEIILPDTEYGAFLQELREIMERDNE
jgi:hypothetical protein